VSPNNPIYTGTSYSRPRRYVTIDDLAHPESEDSEPFIIGEPEFLQPVISFETRAAALMGNEAVTRLLVGSGMEISSYT